MNLQLIDKRRNNTLYSDENAGYKIFNDGYPKNDVFMEAFITSKVESLGINVPEIKEILSIEDKWAFKVPLIKGSTLYEMIMSDSENIDKYLDKLVEIQTYIHSHKCPNSCSKTEIVRLYQYLKFR